MKRHSVFFKLNLLFALALAATLVAGWAVWGHLHKRERMELRLKGRLIAQEFRKNRTVTPAFLENLELKKVEAPELIRKMDERMMRVHRSGRHRTRRMKIVGHDGEPCLMFQTPEGPILLMPKESWLARNWLPLVLIVGMLVMLSLIYWLLRRSLLPLKVLEDEICRYGEGKGLKHPNDFQKGEDEISRLARAFYNAAEKVEKLGESRRLFLRNILHELNTPVTKGKLLAEISEDPGTKRMLHSIFDRLSLLLEDLAQVERIAAAAETPELKPVRIVDLIDQARDRLYMEEPIPYEGENATILADFSSMSVVFKNLIDNGFKYGKKFRIRLRDHTLEFISEGPSLEHSVEWYLQPFRREGGEKTKGFGLGLYIVHKLLQYQEMNLEYRHELGKNTFIITPLRIVV